MSDDAVLNRVKELCDDINTGELDLAESLENLTVCMGLVLAALDDEGKNA